MKVYSTGDFSKFASKEAIDDKALCDAVARAQQGLIDGDLPGFLIKQRVARPGQGRSRGFRAIIVYDPDRRAVFVHGFPKSSKANLTQAEQDSYREFGDIVVALQEDRLDALVEQRKWRRIDCDQVQEDVSE
jgi:hypothetical protein